MTTTIKIKPRKWRWIVIKHTEREPVKINKWPHKWKPKKTLA